MFKLSVAIITFNEERNIKRCLDSVLDLAHEIIVVDSFSSDNTEKICQLYPVQFVQHPFEGYIEQKNHALSLCSGDYILSLDADECVSEVLKEAIRKELTNPLAEAFAMNRLNNYCGTWIKHGGWYPDTKIRLIKKGFAAWGGVNPHDYLALKPTAKLKKLKGDILHYSYFTIQEHDAQSEKFSTIAANALFKKNKKSSIMKILLHPLAKFTKFYFLRMGFLDGKKGFIIALKTAKETKLKYQKLYRLQQNN